MTANPGSAHNGKAVHPSEVRQRIRACSIALSSGSSQLGNLQWSALGQALVVTDDFIVVLSPLTGLHPTLAGQSRTQHVECHPDWNDRFPHSVAQIYVKTFLEQEQTTRKRTLLESDHSSVDPRFQSVQWSSASWSKPDLGPHGSCLILATTSELDLFVLGAPLNAWTGEWKLLHAVSPDPIVDLTRLDAAPSHHGKEVFSPSRALLRKKQMATEVTCASFVDLDGSKRVSVGSNELLSSSQPSSAYIVAGTRSGHIGVWTCAAVSGHCTFVSATPVSSTSIERLIATTNIGSAPTTDVQARIAFQDADGVRLCDLHLLEDKVSVRLSTGSPFTSDHFMITAWRWVKDQLIYSTVGKVHVYDTLTQRTAAFALDTGPNHSFDPFSPTIDMTESLDPRYSVRVILQDLREYCIPSVPAGNAQSAPQNLLPTSLPSTLLGYPPMTENLQREHDLHQAFSGYAVASSSCLASASIVGAVRTNEKVAFLGFNSSENISYQMEVVGLGNLGKGPIALLDEALVHVATGLLPYLVARIVLAALYTYQKQETRPLIASQQQKLLRNQLVSAIEQRWTADAETTTNYSQQQLLYLLACRLQESTSDSTPALDALTRAHRGAVLRDWLQRHDVSSASLITAEQCAACGSQLSFSLDDEFGWARCQKGHVWPRCSVTLSILSDRQVRVCTGCWAKSSMPEKAAASETQGQSSPQALMLKSAATCLYCGGCWIVR